MAGHDLKLENSPENWPGKLAQKTGQSCFRVSGRMVGGPVLNFGSYGWKPAFKFQVALLEAPFQASGRIVGGLVSCHGRNCMAWSAMAGHGWPWPSLANWRAVVIPVGILGSPWAPVGIRSKISSPRIPLATRWHRWRPAGPKAK